MCDAPSVFVEHHSRSSILVEHRGRSQYTMHGLDRGIVSMDDVGVDKTYVHGLDASSDAEPRK